MGIILPVVFVAVGLTLIYEIEYFIKNDLRGLMFPFCDMFEGDDDFDELSLRSRDHAPNEEDYISRNRQIIRNNALDDAQPLLLPDPTTGKPRNKSTVKKEPDKVTVVDVIDVKEIKTDEPDEILVDLNKK